MVVAVGGGAGGDGEVVDVDVVLVVIAVVNAVGSHMVVFLTGLVLAAVRGGIGFLPRCTATASVCSCSSCCCCGAAVLRWYLIQNLRAWVRATSV